MKTLEYDVVVAGGGSAGVAAALAASRAGASTLLVERSGCFGGEATNSWIAAYCGFHTKGRVPQQMVFGVGEEVLQKLRDYGEDTSYVISSSGNSSIRLHPEPLKLAFDELLEASDVDFRLFTSLISAETEAGLLKSVTIMDDEEQTRVFAKAFVDCTGNGNLLHMAGLGTEWGDEDGRVQMASLACLFEHIPRCEIPYEVYQKGIIKAKEAGIPYLDKEKCVADKQPADDYGYITIPSAELEGLDGLSLTRMTLALRRKSQSYARAFREYTEGFECSELRATAPVPGLREARRMKGLQTISGEDVLSCRKCGDRVGRGCWPAEIHKGPETIYREMKEDDYFDIPLGALVSADLPNLFAGGRNISCDPLALASLRVMGTAFVTGQAAGAAAAVYSKDGCAEVSKVQAILSAQGVLL
jgi:hypothetical protein